MRKFYTLILLSLLSLPAFSIDIPEYWLENDKVKGYFSEPEYKSNDYSYTYITKYCYMQPWNWKKLGTGERLDQPLPVPIKLASPLGVESTLYISESEDYADAYTMTIPAGVDSVSVFNLIPEKLYNYKVEYDNGGVITPVVSGQFKTRGHVRMLKIDGIFNVRDLGGWTGLGGHPIKYGKIIRGSRLNVNSSSTKIITADGITELRRLGIRSELDMRNTSNAPMASSSESRHSYLGSDIPIANIDNAYNSRISTFSDAPQSIQGVQQLINWLKQDKPVYLHCSVGADRTGTVAYLVGALCGMSEDALCRDFELTSFSGDSVDNEAAHGTWEVLVRQRTYVGRLDPCSQKDSYQFAAMVDKIKKFPGANLQRKVYYHLSTGAKASGGNLSSKISEADLDWLIKYLVDYVLVKSITTEGGETLTLEPGQTHELKATVLPADATNKTLSYKSSDNQIATVSDEGVITAVGRGTATITVQADDYTKTITVNVPLVESHMPQRDTIYSDGWMYVLKSNAVNLIKNGSFEYGHHFLNWKGANEKDLTDKAFSIKEYENGDSVYIESKADGDSTSLKSLRTMWSIQKGKTYVFGYRVKNSTDAQVAIHPNMATSLISLNAGLNAGGDDFEWDNAPSLSPMRAKVREGMIDSLTFVYPTYGNEWTDVQYIFTNTDGHQYIQVWFTHLSQGGNNTCLDNFYLYEVSKEPIKYCVENDITHAFLNDFSYEGMNLNISYVMDYFNRSHDYRLDAPKPIRLSWTHDPGSEAQRVEVSESSTYSDSIVFTINKDSAAYNLNNMIPGKIYYYRIVSTKGGNDTTVGSGAIEPTGMLRWLLAEGTWNVRDMGGWTGLGGHPIKYGQLFRGGQLTNPKSPYNVILTSAGKEAMRNAGIHAELDLRSSSQAHYSTASFATNSYAADFTNIATTSARMWQYDKDDSNIKAIQWVINELKAGKPVFYHCQNGADRTGTIGFLIGALLGMNESDLAKDYELTTFCQKAVVDFDGTEVGFARLRNYEGKKGSEDKFSDPKDYMFAPLIDKLRTVSGVSIQRKIYDFFKNGKNGTKISEADLDWFIKEMVDYVMVKSITTDGGATLNLEPGAIHALNAVVAPANATNRTLSYKSSDPLVATVSSTGIIKVVGSGTATITVQADDYTRTIKVNALESYVSQPDNKYSDGNVSAPKSNGRIYNLAGQEVKNPGKGVYIKDGKKYIVK